MTLPHTPAIKTPVQHFESTFNERGVRYVRIQWVDLCSQVRCRVLPISYFFKLLRSDRPGVTLTKAALGLVVLQTAPGFSAVGEHIYVVDLSSFRTCSYAPGHAVFFGYLQEQAAVPRPSGPSFEVPFCPRTVLTRLIRSGQPDARLRAWLTRSPDTLPKSSVSSFWSASRPSLRS